jgi:NitT/TauT family transport system substrate-binding protein
MQTKKIICLFSGMLLWLLAVMPLPCHSAEPMKITVSVPGPRNLSYLPIDLINRIGADRDEGARVVLRHTGGGGIALQHMVSYNSDFAVVGLPAVMSQRANGSDVVALAAVDDLPLFVLMVRSDLREKVKSISDLKGRVLGVNTSSLTSKTTSQQLMELVLRSAGVSPWQVRIIPAGQSWNEQSSMLLSGMVDAIMGDEPFATRLLSDGKVFFLMNLGDPQTARSIPGGGFLHAVLSTRSDLIQSEPRKAEIMVKILQRTLRWVAAHTPEQIAEKLQITDTEEKKFLIAALKKYPRIYSPDGRFSTKQLNETERFFHQTSGTDPKARSLVLEKMVMDRWAGRKE